MAPFRGPTRSELLALLRLSDAAARLPVTLGLNAPQASVVCDERGFAIRALELDRTRASAAAREALAQGKPWMPENEFAFLAPGKVLLSSPTKEFFIALVEKMRWTFS